jgi:hypothetical protein
LNSYIHSIIDIKLLFGRLDQGQDIITVYPKEKIYDISIPPGLNDINIANVSLGNTYTSNNIGFGIGFENSTNIPIQFYNSPCASGTELITYREGVSTSNPGGLAMTLKLDFISSLLQS